MRATAFAAVFRVSQGTSFHSRRAKTIRVLFPNENDGLCACGRSRARNCSHSSTDELFLSKAHISFSRMYSQKPSLQSKNAWNFLSSCSSDNSKPTRSVIGSRAEQEDYGYLHVNKDGLFAKTGRIPRYAQHSE